jgi:hypothetical protein
MSGVDPQLTGWAERIRTFKRQVDEALGTSAEFSCTAEVFEARSEIAFCEFESSQPSHGVGRGSRVTVRSAFAFDECSPMLPGQCLSLNSGAKKKPGLSWPGPFPASILPRSAEHASSIDHASCCQQGYGDQS